MLSRAAVRSPDASCTPTGAASSAAARWPASCAATTWSDRLGGARVLLAVFLIATLMAGLLAVTTALVPLTIACLTIAWFLGLGNGAVFKLVAQYFPGRTGAVTGIVGAAGGLGGFFPPLIMGAVQQALGSYTLGFMLLALTALVCLVLTWKVLQPGQAASLHPTR